MAGKEGMDLLCRLIDRHESCEMGSRQPTPGRIVVNAVMERIPGG